jgi:predicted nicotinamide N-methyase
MLFPLRVELFSAAGVSLALFVPDADAVKEAYQNGLISFPYWSQVWPAAKALANFLLCYPDYINAKRVVELGAGLGLPSLVAARFATSVLCTDSVPEAVAIVRQSVTYLHLQNFRAEVLDWQQLPSELSADVLLLSDINYEPDVFASLQTIIASFLQKGTTILISTPQRLMAKEFVLPLLNSCVMQEEITVQHQGSDVNITVMVLRKQADF